MSPYCLQSISIDGHKDFPGLFTVTCYLLRRLVLTHKLTRPLKIYSFYNLSVCNLFIEPKEKGSMRTGDLTTRTSSVDEHPLLTLYLILVSYLKDGG